MDPSINYGYFYAMKFTFLRPMKTIESRRIARWVLPLYIQGLEGHLEMVKLSFSGVSTFVLLVWGLLWVVYGF